MRSTLRPVAVDMGSSSVRVIAGTFDGNRLHLDEVSRFPHQAAPVAGRLVWDLDGILRNVQDAVAHLAARDAITSVGVDSWGVDHLLIDTHAAPVTPAVSYRDERTANVPGLLAEQGITPQWLWSRTGTQPAAINTSHQLVAALGHVSAETRENVAGVLMLSDYVAMQLGTDPGWSQGICSTSGLTAPGAAQWSHEVIDALGLPRHWFGAIAAERTISGKLLSQPSVPVVGAGGHDTACAVHALPQAPGARAFLVSGSWSLVGIETDTPVLDERALHAGLTNEARTDGGNRLLKNLTGLWVLQECQRQWERDGINWSWPELTAAAAEARSAGGVRIDLDAPQFQFPGNMPRRVREAVTAQGGTAATPGEIVRTVLESLAHTYAATLWEISDITGHRPAYVAAVGGGVRQRLLNQLTADACGLPVVVGPAEATSFGSLLAQLEATGELSGTDRHAVLAASCDVTVVEPTPQT